MYQTREAGNSKFKILNSKQIQNSKLVPERHRGFKILNSANQQIRVISAWIYPGISPKNNPIPEDILRELEEI